MKDLVWSYSLKNHNDIKSDLLDIFEVTEKRIEKNDLDLITYTDFRNNNQVFGKRMLLLPVSWAVQ